MASIVLSASVRQNLLSLQSTADLLSTTQSRLATGKKVNSALDNPTNFFTAASLDSRASDINNLLDGIGNGVQVLQAANTGISSLQKLVDSAKSVANQALQTTVGYSSKSSVTSAAITGATANNLLAGTAIDRHRYGRAQQLDRPGCASPARPCWRAARTPTRSPLTSWSPTRITVNGTTINFNSGRHDGFRDGWRSLDSTSRPALSATFSTRSMRSPAQPLPRRSAPRAQLQINTGTTRTW